ncbi:ABC transporter permease [Candidatus Sumerlaeota bacterium]|nr:ABC transporter permease [Candidatus Sumerlaeota bacterium]
MSDHGAHLPETIISSRASVRFMQTLRDVVQYRELFYAFVKRDLMVRYKQTFFGVAWVVMQPLLTGVIFAVVFGMLSGRFHGLEGVVFYLAALVPWTPFQNGVQMASNSMEMNANLISKVYFPRLVIPGAYIFGSVIDFAITFVVFLIAAFIAGQFSPLLILVMPPLLLIQCMAGWGLGLFFAALNAQYRDIKYAVPFLLQTGMFVTVLVPLANWKGIHPALHFLMTLNPMAGVIESYRAILLAQPLDFSLLARSFVVSLLLLVAGIRFFAAREQKLVDIL